MTLTVLAIGTDVDVIGGAGVTLAGVISAIFIRGSDRVTYEVRWIDDLKLCRENLDSNEFKIRGTPDTITLGFQS